MNKTIAICLLFLSGCASRPFTGREKILLATMVGCQMADAYTTVRYIDIGGTELNPILGKRPDSGNVWLFKGLVIGGLYGIGELLPDHREEFYTFGIVVGGGAAAWNDRLYERHK